MSPKLLTEAWRQLSRLRYLLMGLYLPVLALFAAAALLSMAVPSLRLSQLLGDVTAVGHLPFYTGFISQMGVLVWCAGATVCWLSYFYLGRWKGGRPEARRLLLWAGLLTTLLMLDDVYLIHEEIFPEYLHISEKFVQLFYLALAGLVIFLNREEILRSEYALFALALGLFGASLAVDIIPRDLYTKIRLLNRLESVLEDGAKLAGMVTWCAFFVRYVFAEFTRLLGDRLAQDPAQS